jgi:hypothetical protein
MSEGLPDFERGLILSGLVPFVQRVHAFPLQNDDAPFGERAVDDRSRSSRSVSSAVLLDGRLSFRQILFPVSGLLSSLMAIM